MEKKKNTADIEIHTDYHFQEAEWRIERIGWIIGLLLLLAAVMGVFGSGPISKTSVKQGPLSITYDRFVRYRSPKNLEISTDSSVVSDGKLQLWIDRNYINSFNLEKIVPEPDQVTLHPDRIVYTFQASQSDQPLKITFEFKSEAVGLLKGQVGYENQDLKANVVQFAFP